MKTGNSLPAGFQLKGNERTYTIAETLGHGGFGITYRAKAEVKVGGIRMKVDFALKEFFMRDDCERQANASIVYSNPARDRVENSRKDFINEALRLKKIGFSHPNIVGFDEVFEANNTAYYVMEYLRGKSLGDYVKEHGPLTEAETVRLMQPVMEAVELLHRNRICHLDIKPDNIMLEQEENGNIRPVLIDFGLSKHYDDTGHATSTINTFGYSEGYAPAEQYRGITTFSPAADIYALGATLWHCLTGKTPAPALDLRAGELAATLPAGVSEPMRRTIAVMTLDQHQRPDSLDTLLPLAADPEPADSAATKIVNAPSREVTPSPAPVSPAPIEPEKKSRPYLKTAVITFLSAAAVTAVILLIAGSHKETSTSSGKGTMELTSALTVTDSVAQEETPAPAVEKRVAAEKPAPAPAANSRTARPAARPAAPKPAHNTSASQRPINSEGTQGPSKEPTRTTPVAQPAPARTTPARPAQEPNRPTKVEDF
ncbi:MAG: serine/threonine-protein kinase [Lepagella sp.]